jgi:hypothetical protein
VLCGVEANLVLHRLSDAQETRSLLSLYVKLIGLSAVGAEIGVFPTGSTAHGADLYFENVRRAAKLAY